MANILLNKPATANNSFAPFLPSRAVDGNTTDPKSRWVSSQVPAWLSVDLQGVCWVNQWNANFMGSVGWPANYNLSDFKLQGSLDNANWFDMDTLIGNAASQINRGLITPRMVRYLRVYITKGLAINNQVSSIVDFQASEPANAPFLLSLVPGTGSLSSGFSSRNLNYSMNVTSTTTSITFTPTALQSNMTIKVNGAAVTNGQASQAIPLSAGNNSVSIEVTSNDGLMKTTYAVIVNKPSTASYLNTLLIRDDSSSNVALTPEFSSTRLSYTATIDSEATGVSLKPTAQNQSAVIKVNNVAVTNGQWSGQITMNTGINTISITVDSGTTYTIVVTK